MKAIKSFSSIVQKAPAQAAPTSQKPKAQVDITESRDAEGHWDYASDSTEDQTSRSKRNKSTKSPLRKTMKTKPARNVKEPSEASDDGWIENKKPDKKRASKGTVRNMKPRPCHT